MVDCASGAKQYQRLATMEGFELQQEDVQQRREREDIRHEYEPPAHTVRGSS